MRWKARQWFVPIAVLLMLFLFRSFIYRNLISYSAIKEISIQEIGEIECEEAIFIKKLLNHSLSQTARQLHFVWRSASNLPTQLEKGSAANCIGYAAYFAAHLRKCLEQQGQLQDYQIKHQRAHIFLLGYNVHSFIDHPFFADHDVVEIEDVKNGKTWIVDPSLYDYLWIKSY